jgi:TRAP-type uncharacterized transport system substrate-binding protein
MHKRSRAFAALFVYASLLICYCRISLAQDQPAIDQKHDSDAKCPVLGAACPYCPWGALADKVKLAMRPLGYDVQICYNCSGLESVRIVAERRVPPPLRGSEVGELPPPPKRQVDFGVVNLDFFTDAYDGVGIYKSDPPRRDLRLIARIEDPDYYLVATRADALITDLGQIKEKHLPVRILVEPSIRSELILRYYGIDEKELVSWGGSVRNILGSVPDREAYDVVISFANSLNNTPESNVWYELSQRSNLRFIQLPDDLLDSLAKASDWEIAWTPTHLMRGMDHPVKTVVTSGSVVYGRTDMPDRLAYDIAKALDGFKHELVFSIIPFSYNPDLVWKARTVPLHPGAARYYREKGYLKAP